jgi:hypothetical protein
MCGHPYQRHRQRAVSTITRLKLAFTGGNDLRIQKVYLDYTRLKSTVQRSPDISVVRASTATFRITSSVKLAGAASLQPVPGLS